MPRSAVPGYPIRVGGEHNFDRCEAPEMTLGRSGSALRQSAPSL
jgi:hypothetical protein